MVNIPTMNRLNRGSWILRFGQSTSLKGCEDLRPWKERGKLLCWASGCHTDMWSLISRMLLIAAMIWIKWNISFRPIIAPWEGIKQNPWISMIGKSERSHYVHQQADQSCPVKSYDFCLSLCRFFGRPRMYESPFAALDVAKFLQWFEVPSPTSHTDWHSLSHSFWTSPARQPQLKARWWFQIFFIFTLKLGEDSHVDSYFSDGLKPPTRKWSCPKKTLLSWRDCQGLSMPSCAGTPMIDHIFAFVGTGEGNVLYSDVFSPWTYLFLVSSKSPTRCHVGFWESASPWSITSCK